MCHFITLIAPTDEADALRAVMERHGRAAEPINNPSIAKALREGERQYLTTSGHCDCGTILASRHDPAESFEDKLAREQLRLRRKGWSEAKIARALDDRRKAGARPRGAGPDSLELWNQILRDLGSELKLPYAGLFVRLYSGAISTEAFEASRRDVAGNLPWQEALGSIQEDEVTIFSLRGGSSFSKCGDAGQADSRAVSM